MVEIIYPKTLLYFLFKKTSSASIEDIKQIADRVEENPQFICRLDRDSFYGTSRRYPYFCSIDETSVIRIDDPNSFGPYLSKEFIHENQDVNSRIEEVVAEYLV